jgi:mannose/fructose/N-acetylgalactosamine-specific phosphotransferase system component IIC
MENKAEKYREIKSLVIRRFVIKMAGFSLLFVSGILVPLIIRAGHLFKNITVGQERPENMYAILALGIGLLGIITSIQYLHNSMKLLKEKMRKEQAENVSEEERQISSTEKINN